MIKSGMYRFDFFIGGFMGGAYCERIYKSFLYIIY